MSSLLASTRHTRARLRWMVGLADFAKWLPWAVLFLTPAAVSYRFGIVSAGALGVGCGVVGAALLGWSLRAGLRGPSLLDAALRLDAAHHLRGGLAAALEYCGAFGPARGRSPDDEGYVAIVVADAKSLGELSAQRASPISAPHGSVWGGLMGLAWLSLFFVPNEVPTAPEGPAPVALAREETKWLQADDAELLEAASAALEDSAGSDEAKAAAAQFNEIVLKAVAGEIDQGEAFRLAAQLQADLDAAAKESAELSRGLEKRGASLEKREVTRPLGQALQEKNFEEAEKALKRLAERLASDKEPLSDKELDELRASIEEMRGEIKDEQSTQQASAEQDSAEEQSLKERQKRLLQKKKDGTLTKQEKQEMERNERQLKRLSRQKKREQSAEKTLSDLDKQLAEAAKQLQEERKKSGQFMEQAARTLAEGKQKQLTDKEKQELIKQLKALKERLRRQNKDGKQAERLREFQKRARGQEGQKPGQEGKPGGESKPGSGPPRLGPGGAPIPVPGQGERDGEGQGQEPGSGKKPGSGHDPHVEGASSHLDGAKHQDTTAVAQDTGQGQSASETILSVAEEGFTSSSYEKLYREYETVAEEIMDKDTVPVGRKAHVLRYFELIRPRDGGRKAPGDK